MQADNLGSFSEELARILRTDEEDDAISPLKELPLAKPESNLRSLHMGNLMQYTEVRLLSDCQFNVDLNRNSMFWTVVIS